MLATEKSTRVWGERGQESKYMADERAGGKKGRLGDPVAHFHCDAWLGVFASKMLRCKRTEEVPGDGEQGIMGL